MTNAEQAYADILYLNPVRSPESLRKHPRMSLEDRAKIFSPFSPLRGMEQCLDDEDSRLLLREKLSLSEEDAALLDHQLSCLKKGAQITVKHFVSSATEEQTRDTSSAQQPEPRPVLGHLQKTTGVFLVLEQTSRRIRLDSGESYAGKPIETRINLEDIREIRVDYPPDHQDGK